MENPLDQTVPVSTAKPAKPGRKLPRIAVSKSIGKYLVPVALLVVVVLLGVAAFTLLSGGNADNVKAWTQTSTGTPALSMTGYTLGDLKVVKAQDDLGIKLDLKADGGDLAYRLTGKVSANGGDVQDASGLPVGSWKVERQAFALPDFTGTITLYGSKTPLYFTLTAAP